MRPGAHYFLGGAATDQEGRTNVPGLFAVGEAAASGLHGANRLASNSLLEGAVVGASAGRRAALEARESEDNILRSSACRAAPTARSSPPTRRGCCARTCSTR